LHPFASFEKKNTQGLRFSSCSRDRLLDLERDRKEGDLFLSLLKLFSKFLISLIIGDCERLDDRSVERDFRDLLEGDRLVNDLRVDDLPVSLDECLIEFLSLDCDLIVDDLVGD